MLTRVLLLLLLAGGAGACGTAGDESGATASGSPGSSSRRLPARSAPSSRSAPSPPPSTPLSSTELPTLTPPTAPPSTPSDQVKENTVVGSIEAGRLDGCVQLVTDQNIRYTLTGDRVSGVSVGDTAKVRGRPQRQPQRESRCGGIVLRVYDVLTPR